MKCKFCNEKCKYQYPYRYKYKLTSLRPAFYKDEMYQYGRFFAKNSPKPILSSYAIIDCILDYDIFNNEPLYTCKKCKSKQIEKTQNFKGINNKIRYRT